LWRSGTQSRDDSVWWSLLEARMADPIGVPIGRLQGRVDADAGRRRVPAWKRVWQQRPVQSDLFHGRAPDQIPSGPRSEGIVASGNRRQLRVLYRWLMRSVSLRHV